MAFRKRTNRRKDRKRFSKHARKTHRKNLRATTMRGGFRL